MEKHSWRWFNAGGSWQVDLRSGEDIANLCRLDRKHFLVMSMPVGNLRFDDRTLKFLDADRDGRIKIDEVLGAIEFLKARDVDLGALFAPSEADRVRLKEVMDKEENLASQEPGESDRKALAEWEDRISSKDVSFLGDDTAQAYKAFIAVQDVAEKYFTPAEDAPIVMEAPEKPLPLDERINPKFREAVLEFRAKCVAPVLGDMVEMDRLSWKKLAGMFLAYGKVLDSKPVMNADLLSRLEDEEKVLRYKLYLLEFLENFVNMKRLYSEKDAAIFQMGALRIDAKELELCFAVDGDAAHQALSGRSNCCVLYVKLTRPADKAQRSICAVVTAGTIAGLYAGRNGVFTDCSGSEWEACITKVVEAQVSLAEAFWMPWRKLGEGVGAMIKKFFGDRESAGAKSLQGASRGVEAGGAALASSVAAIGIGIGMVGAAAASVMAAVSKMDAWRFSLSLAALVLVVSLPSVVLTWFKLRRRDLGAILNAGGWAVNRTMGFSMARARLFTKCAKRPACKLCIALVVAVILAVASYVCWMRYFSCPALCKNTAVEVSAEGIEK
ncbi:MAG: hypothetical protein J6S30_02315 [Kiritimatiellae bacterium]|nr:hypothetical protein [Kiritimatiellia bacterium]